jgi:hypothetical protein
MLARRLSYQCGLAVSSGQVGVVKPDGAEPLDEGRAGLVEAVLDLLGL